MRLKHGYEKVQHLCTQALKDGYGLAWTDPVCIEKRSSTELSEAINSMFTWYSCATICYAYLDDAYVVEDISNSRWISRGWTLQELIAPSEVVFYGHHWTFLGTKQELAGQLSTWTKIEHIVLVDGSLLDQCGIASRMRWASERETTRTEDVAYCLMGIFNVNMPLLYGEGGKALFRLQEEILKRTQDASILAWKIRQKVASLASHPWYFVSDLNIVQAKLEGFSMEFTGSVVRLKTPVVNIIDDSRSSPVAVLNCRYQNSLDGYIALSVLKRDGIWEMGSLQIGLKVVPHRDVVIRPKLFDTVQYRVRMAPRYGEAVFGWQQGSRRLLRVLKADEMINHGYEVAIFTQDGLHTSQRVSEVWTPTSCVFHFIMLFQPQHEEVVLISLMEQRDQASRAVMRYDGTFTDRKSVRPTIAQLARESSHPQLRPFQGTWLEFLGRDAIRNRQAGDEDVSYSGFAYNFSSLGDDQGLQIERQPANCYSHFSLSVRAEETMGMKVWAVSVSGTGCQRTNPSSRRMNDSAGLSSRLYRRLKDAGKLGVI